MTPSYEKSNLFSQRVLLNMFAYKYYWKDTYSFFLNVYIVIPTQFISQYVCRAVWYHSLYMLYLPQPFSDHFETLYNYFFVHPKIWSNQKNN